jgi:HAD superfamily hydrolase (TIGR01484 family)
MNGYVALILDLDGTLLDENKNISSENLEALKNLKQKGIHIGIFTGRDFEMARGYLDSISAEGPHALQNGALVITGKGKIIDMHNSISRSGARGNRHGEREELRYHSQRGQPQTSRLVQKR